LGFAHLHVHTTYSLLDGYGHPTAFAETCINSGMTALACTDHGTITGHVAHAKACNAIPIWPVYGCEFYLVDDMHQRGISQAEEDDISLRAANVREAEKMRKELQKGAVERWHVVALAFERRGLCEPSTPCDEKLP
jgi:DNA polymerase III alpha subunit